MELNAILKALYAQDEFIQEFKTLLIETFNLSFNPTKSTDGDTIQKNVERMAEIINNDYLAIFNKLASEKEGFKNESMSTKKVAKQDISVYFVIHLYYIIEFIEKDRSMLELMHDMVQFANTRKKDSYNSLFGL